MHSATAQRCFEKGGGVTNGAVASSAQILRRFGIREWTSERRDDQTKNSADSE
jgi:hypothetical protein